MNKLLKKINVLFVVMLMLFSTIIFLVSAEDVKQKTTRDDPVLDLQFYQMDFEFDGILYDDTDWGAVDLFYVGQEPIMYFNLVVNGEWQIINIPVLSSEGIDVDQTMTYYFDLGNNVGEVVTTVTYGYDFTDDIIQTKPVETLSAPVNDEEVVMDAGSEGEMPELSGAKKLVGAKASSTKKHSHTNFPNQECGKKECAPAAVSNSLKFLNTKHNLGLTDAKTSIATMKTAVGFTAGKGAPLYTWWEKKKKYMKDNDYPIVTRKITDISKLAAEIDAGQDVEIQESWVKNGKTTGHTTALRGITKLNDGNYSLDIIDDRKQGEAGGTNKPRTYIYNPKTGNFYEAGFGYTKFEYAVVECPKLPKWTYHFKFPGCPGGTLQVYGTHNCVRQDPPLYNGYAKNCDTYQGYIPKTMNSVEINDAIFDFDWDWWCNNEDHTKFVSPKWNESQNKWELTPIHTWVEANIDSEFLLPTVGDSSGTIQNIFTIVDLDAYLENPVPPQEEYIIENGMCPDLPGYLIGLTPIIFEPNVGPDEFPFFTTPIPYGILTNDADITFSPIPNESPFSPEISGPAQGKPNTNYDYNFVTEDPEGEDVYYIIDWGDGTGQETIGPFESGVSSVATHSWPSKGTYIISAQSKDINDDESEWSTLEVTMPRSKDNHSPLLLRILERFPNVFPILRYIIVYSYQYL